MVLQEIEGRGEVAKKGGGGKRGRRRRPFQGRPCRIARLRTYSDILHINITNYFQDNGSRWDEVE